MEQAIKMMRADADGSRFIHAGASVLVLFRWIATLMRAVFTAMFVPSETDRQIEESRERVRRCLMRS